MNRFSQIHSLCAYGPAGRGLRARRRSFAPALACLLLVPAGCGPGEPVAPDPSEATRTLEQALGFWREGGKIEALADASPPIVASDARWERGEALSQFELDGPPAPSGAHQKFRVKLRFSDARGKPREQTVHYEVGTHPIRTVFRAMFQ